MARFRTFCRPHPGGEAWGAGPPQQQRGGSGGPSPDASHGAASRVESFRDALADDFNTPRAMAEVFELMAEANRDDAPGASEALAEMLALVGLIYHNQPDEGAGADEAETLLGERQAARAAREFERADEIRDRLAEMGWEVRDSAEGAKLVPKG